jgi:hypothetical protein
MFDKIGIWLTVFVVAFAFCLQAQQGIVNGKDDYEFTKTLAEWGYHDLAEDMVNVVAASSLNAEKKQRVALLRCSLLQIKAEQESDFSKQGELYDQAIACYKKATQSAGGTEKMQMQLDLGNLLVQQGEYWLSQKESVSDIEKANIDKKVRALMLDAYAIFSTLKKDTDNAGHELSSKKEGSDEERRVQRAEIRYQAWYGMCRALYMQAMSGDKNALKDCQKNLEGYIWDYEGKLGAFFAMILRGMVLHEQKKYQDAVDSFEGVFRPCYDILFVQKNDHPKSKTLLLQATYYKIRTLVEWRYYDKAIAAGQELRKVFEAHFKTPLSDEIFGQAILLEMGKAHVGQSEYAKAMDVAQKVAEKKNYWGLLAKKLLQDWGKINPKSLNTPKNAYLVATGLFSQDKYTEAILSFLKVIELSTSQEDIEAYAMDAWEKMAQCYWTLDLFQEAAVCYATCAEKYKNFRKVVKTQDKVQKLDIAPKCAYWAYRGYSETFKYSKDETDKSLATAMRNFLLSNWKNSGFAYNLSFDKARDEEVKAENTSSLAEAAINYRAAAEAYREVNKEADLYERAVVSVGKCYFKAADSALKAAGLADKKPGTVLLPQEIAADYQRAEKELLAFQEFTQKNQILDVDTERRGSRREALAQTLFYLGQIALQQNKNIAAKAKWEELYKTYPEQKEMIGASLYLFIKLEVEDGRLAEAEALIKIISGEEAEEVAASIRQYQSFCYYLIGREYLKKAEAAKPDLKDPENVSPDVVALYEKAAYYLRQWIVRKENAKLVHYEWAGEQLLVFAKLLQGRGDDVSAKEWYRHVLDIFKKCMALNPGEEKKAQIQPRLGECSVKLEDWEEAVYVLYPIYQQSKDKTRKGGKDSKEKFSVRRDPMYIGYLTQAFIGLSEATTLRDAQKLYGFLLPYVGSDLQDDFSEFCLLANATGVVDQYKQMAQTLAWLEGKFFSDSERQELDKDVQKEKEKIKDTPGKLKYVYRERYHELLARSFPLDGQPAAPVQFTREECSKRVKKLSLFMAYQFSSLLVETVPRYKTSGVSFGAYDNNAWWDAKYWQIYAIFLRDDKESRKEARALIGKLQLQQSKMGGTKYFKKFTELQEKNK